MSGFRRTVSIFAYPVVISEKGGFLVLECPDFGVFQPVNSPDGYFVGVKTAVSVGYAWLQLMKKVHLEIKNKESARKPLPKPSLTKEVFDKESFREKVYSPEEVALIVGVSVNTIRRALDQKKVDHIKTPGGHRRMSDVQVKALREVLSPKQDKSRETPNTPL